MRNSNAVGESDQIPTDGSFLQKHRYVFKSDGNGNSERMQGDEFQPDGRVGEETI